MTEIIKKNRENYCSEIFEFDSSEMNRLLGIIPAHFEEKWLESNTANSIARLWKRKDNVAKMELLSLAVAIEKLLALDDKWLKDQINKVKSSNVNQSRGAIFEILGASYMANDGYLFSLAAKNEPGIDAFVILNTNQKHSKIHCLAVILLTVELDKEQMVSQSLSMTFSRV